MIEEREFRGYWWLPENPDRQVGGVATFSKNKGVQLEVFSAFNPDIEDTFRDSDASHDTILGHSTGNDLVTVQGAMRTGSNTIIGRESGAKTEEYVADTLLSGGHFVDGVEFNQVNLKYPLLKEWAGQSGVTETLEQGEDGGVEGTNIEYRPPDIVSAELSDAKLRLKTDAKIGHSGGISITEHTHFNVKPDSGSITLDESMDYLGQLQDFLTLATGTELPAEELVGRVETDRPDIDGQTFKDIDVMYQTGSDIEPPESKHPMRWNFRFSDIEDRFEMVMNDWFEKYEDLNPVNQLYFSTKYNSNMYVENEFLTLTRALEGYHRIVVGGQYLSDGEFGDYRDELEETIHGDHPTGFKDHLKHGTFKHANEYSLGKRLGELIDEHIDTLSVLPVEMRGMGREISKARNDLTHRESDDDIDGTHDFIRLTWVAQALMEVVLLSEIEIPAEQVRNRISNRYTTPLSQ